MKKIILIAVLIILALAALLYYFSQPAAGQHEGLAKCIASKGAKFYGAFWCPHCKEQKEMFGSSAQYLPYVECSTPDGNSQTQVCTAAGIDGYPTWEFADRSRLTGAQPLEALAAKTNCTLKG